MKRTPDKNDLPAYAQHYSSPGFLSKLRSVARFLGEKTTWYALLLYYTLQSPSVPKRDKIAIMGALGYLILPLDLVPDFIPFLGLADDAAAINLVFDLVRNDMTPEIEKRATARLAKLFPL